MADRSSHECLKCGQGYPTARELLIHEVLHYDNVKPVPIFALTKLPPSENGILQDYRASPEEVDSYPKAIAQLQECFSREDLLVQFYPALYDELEAKIQALESLGQTQDKYGEFLSSFVDFCLSEDILLAFERSKNFKEDTLGEGRTLKQLMNFLKQEVKNDEIVELARNNFSAPVNQKKRDVNKPDKFPCAAMLVNTHDRNGTGKQNLLCRFCNKGHSSNVCLEARKMTLDEKKKCVLRNRACFSCFSVF
ncbi:uncharacterized protein TNCV_1891181 [Trichonephila clavipes]|nr:uncharacterized protein TNCV_1891181 [Trichonephila clavipes]